MATMTQKIRDQMYAIAVRDNELWLFLRIRRNAEGEIFTLFPRVNKDGWNPHASYHKDGRYHQKSFDHRSLVRQGPKPDEYFRGVINLETTPIATAEPRAINVPCKVEQFAKVVEIPISVIRPEKYQSYIAINLVEPGCPPIILPGARVIQQEVFQDAIPWILVTLFEDRPGAFSASDST